LFRASLWKGEVSMDCPLEPLPLPKMQHHHAADA